MNETWVEIAGYPNYAISNEGSVMSYVTDAILRPRPNDKGYLRVALTNENGLKDFYIHQLVAQAFMGNFEMGEQLIHINGDLSDNRPGNLHPRSDIVARSAYRRRMRISRGTSVRIKETGDVFSSVRDCADHIDGDYSSIYQVLNGKRHTHKGYTFEYFTDVREDDRHYV